MKILITNCHLVFPHGSEIWTAVICRELMRRGHQVFLYTPEIGPYHAACLRDVPTIAGPGEWMDGRFDIAILQHLNPIRETKIWEKTITPCLPDSERIIVICHGAYTEAELPVVGDYLKNAVYVCISREIAREFPHIDWRVVKQPIDPTWFALPAREFGLNPLSVLWASHRQVIPKELIRICTDKSIPVYLAGHKTMYPDEVREIYQRCDLVLGTGRWIYEGMAAGIPCVVADRALSLGYVTPQNVSNYEESNMTLRHRNASAADWNRILVHYNPALGKMMREYAASNYRVSIIVDQFLEFLGLKPEIERVFNDVL